MELIYIGDKFYWESGTSMSSIYTTDSRRSDWGDVQITLQRGENVSIRPANDYEMGYYEKELKRINFKDYFYTNQLYLTNHSQY